MSTNFAPWKLGVVGLSLLGIVTACVVSGGGYDTEVGVGYVGGYYAPSGYEYGGWGRGYHVGPPRGGEGHDGRSGRAAPSIPNRPRGHR
jgi:hypothetical protein